MVTLQGKLNQFQSIILTCFLKIAKVGLHMRLLQ